MSRKVLVPLGLLAAASDPTGQRAGDSYFNTTSGKIKVYNGASWSDAGVQGTTGTQGTTGSQGTIGTQGTTGSQGTTGAQGTAGSIPGFYYIYDATTTAADPGSGYYRLNSVTAASVTEMYISETDADATGRANQIALWDDSTNTTNKGTLFFAALAGGGGASFTVTGNITDNGTWRTVPVSYVSGTFPGAVNKSITFTRTGDTGAQGTSGTSILTTNNSWSGTNTFSNQITSTLANNTADAGGQILLNGANGNRIDFNAAGGAAPSFTTRSAGTKIVLYPAVAAASVDHAIGVESFGHWVSVPTSASHSFKWYGGTTLAATLTGAGALSTTSTISASGLAGSLLSSTVGAALGTAAAGTSAIPARADHVHSADDAWYFALIL